MSNIKYGQIEEIAVYDEILDFFEEYSNDHVRNLDEKKQWKESFLLSVMNKVISTKNTLLITNVSILSLALFEDLPFDLYTNRGLRISRLSKDAQEEACCVLREEFLS